MLDHMIDQLFGAYNIWALVQSTSAIDNNTGPPSQQIISTIQRLVEIVASRQNYKFGATLKEFPNAVTELGWIVDNAIEQSTKFLKKLSFPLNVSSVYGVNKQKGSNVLLLSCYGHIRSIETPEINPKKIDALISSLRFAVLPQMLLPEMYGDGAIDLPGVAPSWIEFGPGEISGYFNSRLEESESGVLSTEREHFHNHCRNEIKAMVSRIERALNSGESVKIPLWGLQTASCRDGMAKAIAHNADGTVFEIAAGCVWVVSASQLGANVKYMEITPSSKNAVITLSP